MPRRLPLARAARRHVLLGRAARGAGRDGAAAARGGGRRGLRARRAVLCRARPTPRTLRLSFVTVEPRRIEAGIRRWPRAQRSAGSRGLDADAPMNTALDHLVVVAHDLEQGAAWAEAHARRRAGAGRQASADGHAQPAPGARRQRRLPRDHRDRSRRAAAGRAALVRHRRARRSRSRGAPAGELRGAHDQSRHAPLGA